MILFIGAGFYAPHSPLKKHLTVVNKTVTTDHLYQQPDNTLSKTIDFLIAGRQADIPQKILFIQTQKNLDGKFFLPVFSFGQDFISRPPTHLGLACSVYSTHPYTQLDKSYYLYTLKKILI